MAQIVSLRTNEFDETKAFMEKRGYGGFACKEDADEEVNREHYHWYIIGEWKNINAFRSRLKADCPSLRGNGMYSLSTVRDKVSYARYVCKGKGEGQGFDLVWRNSLEYTEEMLEQFHMEWWLERKRLLKKRKTGSMVDALVATAKEQKLAGYDRRPIVRLYIEESVARGRPINVFSARGVVNTVCATLSDDYKEKLEAEIMDRF